MALTLIDNHVEAGLSRLLQRNKESYNINSLLSALIEPIQEIENQIYDLYTERSLDTSIGKQLDGIGKIVGLDRDGRDDIDYRSALIIQIQINKAGGEPESIITAIRQLFKTEIITFKEIYPANYEVYIASDTIVENAKALITSISPAGVGNIVLLQGTGAPFCLDDINLVNVDYDVNKNGDNLIVDPSDNGLLQVITQDVVQSCNGLGFAEVFLNEALYSFNGIDQYLTGDTGDNLEVILTTANEDYRLSSDGGIMAEVLN